MPKTMKAAVLREYGTKLEIEEVPVPEPGDNDVIIKIMASGVCMTDTRIVDGILKTAELPFIPGHEMAGIVHKTGSKVEGFEIGDHVLVGIDVVCHECEACLEGRENLCEKRIRLGMEVDGSHAEYVKAPSDNLVPIADHVPFHQAAIMPDAVATIYHAIKQRGQVKKGHKLLFHGVGGLGLQGVQIAKHFETTVFASDREDIKLEKAKEFGADVTINTLEKNLYDTIVEETDGRLCDVAFDMVGTTDSINELLTCIRPGGKVIAVAYAPETFTVNYQEVVIKEKEILGTRGSTRQDLREVAELVEKGIVEPFVSDLYRLEDINNALDALRERRSLGRGVVVFDETLLSD